MTPHHYYNILFIKSKSITPPNTAGKKSTQGCEYQKGVIGSHLTDVQPHTISCISLILHMGKLIFCDSFNWSKFMSLTNRVEMNVKINKREYNKLNIFCTAKEAINRMMSQCTE